MNPGNLLLRRLSGVLGARHLSALSAARAAAVGSQFPPAYAIDPLSVQNAASAGKSIASTSSSFGNAKANHQESVVSYPFFANEYFSSSAGIYESSGTFELSAESRKLLQNPINSSDIDITPDGLIYLSVSKYKQILNAAFGPGSWALVPRGPVGIIGRVLTREYALVINGKFVSQARGEQMFFNNEGIPTAVEGARSSALSRCCKDLGIAVELWDRAFITSFKKENCSLVAVMQNNARKMLWRRKDRKFEFPIREI